MPRILNRAKLPRPSGRVSGGSRRGSSVWGTSASGTPRSACHTQHYHHSTASDAMDSDNGTTLSTYATPSSSAETFLSYLLQQSSPGLNESSGIFLSAHSIVSNADSRLTSGNALANLFATKMQVTGNVTSPPSSPPPSIASSDTSSGRETPCSLLSITSSADVSKMSIPRYQGSSSLLRASRASSLELTALGGDERWEQLPTRRRSSISSVKEELSASWGQFVDVAEEDDQIERYRRTLSSRHARVTKTRTMFLHNVHA